MIIALQYTHTNTARKANKMNEAINKIAKAILDIETLETRHSDKLDFYGLGVLSIKEALEAAYKAGQESKAK